MHGDLCVWVDGRYFLVLQGHTLDFYNSTSELYANRPAKETVVLTPDCTVESRKLPAKIRAASGSGPSSPESPFTDSHEPDSVIDLHMGGQTHTLQCFSIEEENRWISHLQVSRSATRHGPHPLHHIPVSRRPLLLFLPPPPFASSPSFVCPWRPCFGRTDRHRLAWRHLRSAQGRHRPRRQADPAAGRRFRTQGLLLHLITPAGWWWVYDTKQQAVGGWGGYTCTTGL